MSARKLNIYRYCEEEQRSLPNRQDNVNKLIDSASSAE